MKHRIGSSGLISAVIFLVGMASTSAAAIQVTSPNGGETWHKGSAYDITWTSGAPYVDIELRKGGSFSRTLAGRIPGPAGRFRWLIPTDIEPGTDYRIRVQQSSGSNRDASNRDFEIAEAVAPPPGLPRIQLPGNAVPLRQPGVSENVLQRSLKTPLKNAELELRFQNVVDSPEYPRVGETFQKALLVVNSSAVSARIYLATVGDRPGFVERLSDNVTVNPHGRVDIPVRLTVTKSHIREGTFTGLVYIVDADARGTGIVDVIWKDSNKDNNVLEVISAIQPTQLMLVLKNMTEFVVLSTGDGDRRDPGEFESIGLRLCQQGGRCSGYSTAFAIENKINKLGRTGYPLEATVGDILTADFGSSTAQLAIPYPATVGDSGEWYWFEIRAFEGDPPCFAAGPANPKTHSCGNTGTYSGHFHLVDVRRAWERARGGIRPGESYILGFLREICTTDMTWWEARPSGSPTLAPRNSEICVRPVY